MRPMAGEAFVGIDISKAHLDLAWDGEDTVACSANDAASCAAVAAELKDATLVVVEATGGYELEIVLALQAAQAPIAVVNPRRVRDFARASGRLAKWTPGSSPISPGPCGRRRPHKSKTAAWPWGNWSPGDGN